MIDRKPSHFGSKLSAPAGIRGTDLASIGATGGMTGKRNAPIVADGRCSVEVEAAGLEPVAFGRELDSHYAPRQRAPREGVSRLARRAGGRHVDGAQRDDQQHTRIRSTRRWFVSHLAR